jgi:hypothetical protein
MQASYPNLLAITANSAIDTAAICYRKARNDCYRIHSLLTHPRTVQAAKIAVWCLYLGAVVAYALGQSARILVDAGAKAIQQWAESEVQSCIATEAPQPQTITEPDHFRDVTKMIPVPAPAMAQAITAPVATLTIRTEAPSTEAPAELASILASMTSTELRKECQSAGVKWRNAHGKGRHLTKAAMVEAMVAALAA